MRTVYLNRKEAAELSGLSMNAVKNAVDKGIVPEGKAKGGRSRIEVRDVAALVMLRSLDPLDTRQKRRVRDWLRTERGARTLQLTEALSVEKTTAAEQAAREAERYAELRERWIVSDPGIRGGEPVIRGSRVSVYTLAERLTHGESDAVLDDDYPHIPKEAREVAARYARTHPRAGRPRTRGIAA